MADTDLIQETASALALAQRMGLIQPDSIARYVLRTVEPLIRDAVLAPFREEAARHDCGRMKCVCPLCKLVRQ